MSPDTSVAEILDTMDYGPAPESDAEAKAWLKRHGQRLRLLIDGKWVDPKTKQWFDAINPATGATIARVAQAGPKDVDAAVAAATRALPGWRDLGGHGRARHLYALARLIQRHGRLLAVLETIDNGKPIRETRDLDIPLAARHFYHHAGWAQLIDDDPELRDYAPVGVCGQIIPWNFPLLMLAWKIAPALACGNTVVLKPAEFTSFTALQFAELTREAGLPPGVVNIVTGDGETGKLIVDHPEIDKIAFTGSTEVGRGIRRATAGTGKALTLELGGKSPFVVFDDADLDSAVEGVVDAIWFNQGEVCCAGSRLLVQEGVADAMIAKLKARMETLRLGDPLDKAVDLGAVVAPVQLQRIHELVEQGRAEGVQIWQPSWAVPKEGCFYPPTLCTDVEPASTLAQVEIFGPVLATMTFRTPDEAVALANDTPYGLAASVWTESVNLALDIAPQLQCGVVWVNATNLFDAAAGFGGYKESGYGREGGREGLFAYLKPAWTAKAKPWAEPKHPDGEPAFAAPADGLPGIDRTAKLYIGGKQTRPDGGYSRPVLGPDGGLVGEVGDGNRKDIRNAVEAARKAAAWAGTTGHARAQILYYVAENLAARGGEFAERLRAMTGAGKKAAAAEVEAAVRRLFTWAAWADKHDGAVKPVPVRGVAVAMHEPIGVIGLACPTDAPLLGFVSMVAPEPTGSGAMTATICFLAARET
ncbi:MAG: aldehyde dehydrogenase family protein, partial [Alphaproteobacteria bacterium]|nr:aldehyde dehydrogenase family protein [Alphaproteobacteria bacterium]